MCTYEIALGLVLAADRSDISRCLRDRAEHLAELGFGLCSIILAPPMDTHSL